MPSRINGIGTWYYGKENLIEFPGVCSQCNRETTLRSYDTTSYITFLYIPIIPLGKKRIGQECSHCRKHSRISLSRWLKQRDEAYAKTTETYESNPKDAEAAKELIAAIIAFEDVEMFRDWAPDIRQNQSENQEILNLLGHLYGEYGIQAEAVELFQESLSLQDDPEVHEMLAEALIKLKRPDEAGEHLGHILEGNITDKVGYLVLLAQGYQALGEHQSALDILDQAETLVPDVAEDTDYRRIREKSEKNLETRTPIKVPAIEGSAVVVEPTASAGVKYAKLAGPLVLGMILGIYMLCAYVAGTSRDIYIVNGLAKSYTVEVDGKRYTLASTTPRKITISEGTLEISVSDPGLSELSQTYKIETPFWKRPFLDKTFLVNPDATAPVLWEKIFYGPENFPESTFPEGDSSMHVGQTMYEFDNIDYHFVEFPAQIELSSDDFEPRERLGFLTDYDVSGTEVIANLIGQIPKEVLISTIKTHLRYEPEVHYYVNLLKVLAEPEDFVQTIRLGLEAKPIRIEWHRSYQETMETSNSEYDLEAEYRTRLEQEPENSIWQYLLGRILRNPEKAEGFYRQSISGPSPCAYGYNALAYQKMSTGQFSEAVEIARQAQAAEPENRNFNYIYRQALEAAGLYEQSLQEYQQDPDRSETTFTWLIPEVRLQFRWQGREAAKKRIRQWQQQVRSRMIQETLQTLTQYIESELAYWSGDLQAYTEFNATDEAAQDRLQLALTCGTPIEPNMLEDDELVATQDYLLAYIALRQRGSDQEADRYLTLAIEDLREENWEKRTIAECLAGKKPEDPLQICKLAIWPPEEKAVFLVCLGLKYPDQQKPYYALAKKLNYQIGFPHLFLKAIMQSTGP